MYKVYNNSKKSACLFAPKTKKVAATVSAPAADKSMLAKYSQRGKR